MPPEQQTARVIPFRVLPGGADPTSEETMVALLIGGGLLALWGLRRGLKGIGPVQLTGSGISGAEFAAYLLVIGGIIRTAQASWPDNPIVRASSFVY